MRLPLLNAGFVYLISLTPGFQWEDKLPLLTIPATPGVCLTYMPFPGVTDDSGLLQLTRDFVDVLNGVCDKRFERGAGVLALSLGMQFYRRAAKCPAHCHDLKF